jgi:hypothetical protein
MESCPKAASGLIPWVAMILPMPKTRSMPLVAISPQEFLRNSKFACEEADKFENEFFGSFNTRNHWLWAYSML